MINRNKLEHILEYAKQQRYIGQSCKVPPEDMVEIMERLLSACNSPAIPDGSADMLRRWLAFVHGMQNAGCQLPHNLIVESEAMLAAAQHDTPALNPVQSVDSVADRWIPVSERIPDNAEPVLCIEKRADFGTYGQPFVCWHDGGGWVGKTNYRPIVTHWMPLPAAPQEVGDA